MKRLLIGGLAALAIGAIGTPVASAATADAHSWASAPACPPGSYTNPDDLNGACLPGGPHNDFVALAVSPSSDQGGWGTDGNQDGADRIALAQCVANSNSVCQVVARMHNGCAAIAIDGSAVVHGGTGADAASASANALSGLTDGQLVTVQCSKP
jgi:hypothetical protein